MKIVLLAVCGILLGSTSLHAYHYLRVGDPRNSWYTQQGSIEEASLSIRPNGAYIEYGLYLTFSSKGTDWTSVQDTLEIVLDFDLPENAIVHDSWLWVGDDIVRAVILDKWTASSIYEGIVQRRQDPSILTKQSATQYELRVFPMAGNETRKVKISYLMPAAWSKDYVKASLPTAILGTSKHPLRDLHVFAWSNSTWVNPRILTDTETLHFSEETDPAFGDYHRVDIETNTLKKELSVCYDNPMTNGYYFSKYQEGDEGVYQLVMMPNDFVDATQRKKIAILVDYDVSNTTLTQAGLLGALKNQMLENLNEADSFNLIFSNLTISRYSQDWVQATESNIETAFADLSNPMTSYSNLPALLGNGIDFVKSTGEDGKIILVSNSDNYGDFQVGNTLITDILALMDQKIQIHISDYQSINFPYYYINGYPYQGNEYFYANLSRLTSGSYHAVKDGFSLSEVINQSFKYLGGSITSFDLYTKLKNGFCHSRYALAGNQNIAYLNDPVIQVGKFKGTLPFIFEISGEYDNEIFSRVVEVPEQMAQPADSLIKKIWAGQYIKALESGQQTNDIINQVIFHSMSERVLSHYTAFLCLEDPNMVCYDCLDESKLVDVEAIDVKQDTLQVYPNPFTDLLTIDLYCSHPEQIDELAIYSITGTLVHRFDTSALTEGKNTISWSAGHLDSGVYILVCMGSESSHKIKLVKQ